MERKNISTDILLMGEISNNNDWYSISRNYYFTDEQIYSFRDKIHFYFYLKNNNKMPNISIIEKILDDNNLVLKEEDNIIISEIYGVNNFEFIKKYKDKLHVARVLYLSKFKISEVLQLIELPKVGDGVSIAYGSDSEPYTIIDVNKSGTKIAIQRDNAEPADGYDYYSNQVYNYTRNPNGKIEYASLRKNGMYKIIHSNTKVHRVGRKKYQNPSF